MRARLARRVLAAGLRLQRVLRRGARGRCSPCKRARTVGTHECASAQAARWRAELTYARCSAFLKSAADACLIAESGARGRCGRREAPTVALDKGCTRLARVRNHAIRNPKPLGRVDFASARRIRYGEEAARAPPAGGTSDSRTAGLRPWRTNRTTLTQQAMGQAASDGGAGPELDITLDAVTDDELVKDLSQIVETQEATKQQLLNQIASCQRQLDRLQAVSDAGTLTLRISGRAHPHVGSARAPPGEALVKGEASLDMKDLLGVDPNGDQSTFTREEKARFRHINGGSEGLAVRSVASASITCKAREPPSDRAYRPGASHDCTVPH